MFAIYHFIVGLAVGSLLYYVIHLVVSSKRKYPPGPRGLPLLGNIADLPPVDKQEWIHWLGFKDLYGPISSVTVLGKTIVVLHDKEAAFELLERRSAIMSSRPVAEFAGRLNGWDKFIGFMPYGDRLRAQRRITFGAMGTKVAAARYSKLQEVEARRLVVRILDDPNNVAAHARREAGSIILKIAYGYNVEAHGSDPLVDLADRSLDHFSVGSVPGRFMVDIMPFLKYVPEWLPGTSWKQLAREWKQDITDLAETPYAFVKQEMRQGGNSPSIVSENLEKLGKNPSAYDEEMLKYSSGALYAGGADTTVSSIVAFVLAMSLYPTVQQKAQSEIDRVVGRARFPTTSDRPHLPYINAIVQEVLRWHPIGPMGLPHESTQDTSISGYFIPKGSMILANIWFFAHDESVYPDPMVFNPDRFLGDKPQPDPHDIAFGFGRRACPGRWLADNTLFITIAHVLAGLHIQQPNGAEVPDGYQPEFLPGVISHPAPFRFEARPRTEEAERLIRDTERVFPWEKSQAGALVGMRA